MNVIYLYFDTNIVYAIRLIVLLTKKVDLWNNQAQQRLDMEQEDGDNYWKKLFETYVEILECYDLYKKTYKLMILFHTVDFFYNTLMRTQLVLDLFYLSLQIESDLWMQTVYKLLKITEEIQCLAFANWCSIVALHAYHISWILFSYFLFPTIGSAYNVTSYCCTILDTNLLYAIRTMKLLILPLEKMVRHIKSTRFDEEESWDNMLKVYKDILEAYGMFEKKFEILIVLYAIQTTLKALLAVIIRIELWKASLGNTNFTEYLLFSLISLTWIFKNILLFIFLSVTSERLYSAMEEIQSTCKQFFHRNVRSVIIPIVINLSDFGWTANMQYNLNDHWVRRIKLMSFDEEESWTNMLNVYKDILEAYGIFEDTFQHMIVLYALQTTVRSLLAVLIRIELWKVSSERTNMEYFLFSIISISWVFKNIMLFVLLSVESERLYAAMEEVQTTCKLLTSYNQCSEIIVDVFSLKGSCVFVLSMVSDFNPIINFDISSDIMRVFVWSLCVIHDAFIVEVLGITLITRYCVLSQWLG
ncbi:hypothetical protein HW555_012971 [Spodoptera exigua]|uniref:Gustatory receptor n=1 Tax=Spodoptera exigua TaxID=7107 RepID=A0A835G651_SPOEX|nr:hypothetical protein HW555_012971 [Spodoptera exigua]